MTASSDEQNPETGYLEDCCWTDPQDQCPKRRMNPEPCRCRCHQDEKPSALTADEARELAWLRDDRAKWHGAYMGAVRLAEESGKQRDAAEQRAQAAEAERDALRERERQVQDAVRLFVNRLDGIGMWADERLSGEERRWLTSELVKANTDLEAVSGILKARALLRAAEGGER